MCLSSWFRFVFLAGTLGSSVVSGNPARAEVSSLEQRIILAVGAHAGDMEVAAGALLAKHVRGGDRVVLVHLTLGEGGNPKLSPADYGAQKRREAEDAAKVLGAEVVFGPFKDGQLADNDAARLFLVDVIRRVKPTHLITHWAKSLHPDHEAAHSITNAALLMASLPGVETEFPAHRGVRGLYYTDNWEDDEGFQPYITVDVSGEMEIWERCVTQYEFIRGGISRFPYLEYYRALAKVRGARSGMEFGESLDIDSYSKKRVLERLP